MAHVHGGAPLRIITARPVLSSGSTILRMDHRQAAAPAIRYLTRFKYRGLGRAHILRCQYGAEKRWLASACRGDTTIFIVVTGGPSVGKTTIITSLKARGHTIISEQATQIIKEGDILPWVDRDAFQREVLRRQLEVETPHLNSAAPVFLDRGLFDGEAYYISDGLPIPPAFSTLPSARYELALLIEELPFFDNNGVRFEDLEFTRKITPIIEDCYRRRGVAVQRVPAMPPDERVEFVTQVVRERIESAARTVVTVSANFALAT